tara:strand:+ start:271 stop:474 length:204 start_codon:yes stop_codon:yes gene_type:complete
MGPYSEDVQYRRAANLGAVLLEDNIDPDFRKIYELKLRNLARTEDQYLERVKQVYSGPRWNLFTSQS